MAKSKGPTDAAIIKAFQKLEEAGNVFMALLREDPERVFTYNTDASVEASKDNIYKGHSECRMMAVAAYNRQRAKGDID